MIFNSIDFLIFFPIVTTAYFLLPHRFRWIWLLAASCYFYMSFIPAYLLVLALTISVDYLSVRAIERSTTPAFKKTYLATSIVMTGLILFIFKYFNFFNTNVAALAHTVGWNYSIESLMIILPIGLSFHTFQSMSYVIEVYRGKQKAENHFGVLALYVLFFPQLVAGPIERPQNLLHQFYEVHKVDWGKIESGACLMLYGFFKKMVIADRLAVLVNSVYGNPHVYGRVYLVLATVSFAFQIYCDFSGYSDIARGAARIMGFELMTNFDNPYHSKSIGEFWRRWHISLSTWFKDYVYIPLGGSHVTVPRWSMNILLVFLLSGLWHGANWTFLLWGLLHGTYLIASRLSVNLRKNLLHWTRLISFPRVHTVISICITFTLVTIGWVFFRASTLSDAFLILTRFFFADGVGKMTTIGGALAGQYTAIVGIILMELIERVDTNRIMARWPWSLSVANLLLILIILLFGVFYKNAAFIYSQF